MSRNAAERPSSTPPNHALKTRRRLGKYRIRRHIGAGAFATVYEAYDSIEGISVALKIPHPDHVEKDSLSLIHKEVRLTARLDRDNILPLHNAMMIHGYLVIATPLGEPILTDRLHYHLGPKTALSYTEQLLDALAYSHEGTPKTGPSATARSTTTGRPTPRRFVATRSDLKRRPATSWTRSLCSRTLLVSICSAVAAR